MMVCDHPASASFEAMISRKLKDNEVKIRMHFIIESEENTEMGGNHQELLASILLRQGIGPLTQTLESSSYNE